MNCFSYAGNYYVQSNLMEIWEKLCDPSTKWKDPPILRDDVKAWLEARGIDYSPLEVKGIPEFIFPNETLSLAFREAFF
jgi:hypothetical protein